MLDKPPWLEKQRQEAKAKDWLRRAHHILMKEYGWIPFEEFKKLPMSTIWGLLKEIIADKKDEEREMKKMKIKSKSIRRR